MSAKSISSSPLRFLVRNNRSRSTVSSSDTEFDSAGYASSSGTTTPEDDEGTFDLSSACGPISSGKSKYARREKLTIFTKSRDLSSTLNRVKKVAYALATFKRKRPDDISPILISSPLRERFGKRMSVKPQPDERFYSLPNRRFSFSDVRTPQHDSHTITRRFGTISGSASGFAKGTSQRQRSGLRMPSFSDQQQSTIPSTLVETAAPPTQRGGFTWRTVLVQILRVMLFVPWCAAVGGAVLLFPSHTELVTFRVGYIDSRRGLRRFAYWAECGQQHVAIFLACLVTATWYHTALGLSLTGIAVSRFVIVWHAFRVDERIPLGEDDQQSLYLVVTGLESSVTRGGGEYSETLVDNSESVAGEGVRLRPEGLEI